MENLREEVRRETDDKLAAQETRIETLTNEKLKESEDKTQEKLREFQSNLNEDISRQDEKIEKLNKAHTKTSNQASLNREHIRQNQQFATTQFESIKGELDQHNVEIQDLQNAQGQLKIQISQIENKTPTSDVAQILRDIQIGVGTPDITLVMPTFNAKTTSPVEYIERIKKYIFKLTQRRGHQNVDFRDILENSLLDHSSRWWQMTKASCENFDDFQRKFLDKYWCADTQRGLRRKMENSTYNPHGTSTRAEYFVGCALKLSTLTPPLAEEEIINIMTEHYETQVRDAKRVQNITTIYEFEKLLNRMDIEDKQTRGQRRNPYNNHQNTQPNHNNRQWNDDRRKNYHHNGNNQNHNNYHNENRNNHSNNYHHQRRNSYEHNRREDKERYTGNRYQNNQEQGRRNSPRRNSYHQENNSNPPHNNQQQSGYPQERSNQNTYYNSRYKPTYEQENACRVIRLQHTPLITEYKPTAPPMENTTSATANGSILYNEAKITSLN